MKTLIELYDERAIENLIGPETFKPEQIVYICPTEVAQDKKQQASLVSFLSSRGLHAKAEFLEASLYKSDRILKQLLRTFETHSDCALDVTGGTDAALFAAGMFSSKTEVPTFTYSRHRNCFYDIHNASFADELPCSIEYKVEDFFRMTGGTMERGRVDNSALSRYMDTFDDFFRIFLRHRREWQDFIVYMQRATQNPKGENISLKVDAAYTQKGEHGSKVHACPAILEELEKLGYIKELEIVSNERVRFRFADEQVRFWLRDTGSVLELYMYRACVQTGIFGDVVSSAVVAWDGTTGHGSVSNEIDVAAARGIIPLFISCKTCEIKTEALNELAVLKDRFGGKGAKAAIVTSEECGSSARHRAAQLGIAVIDIEELSKGKASDRLKVIMKALETMPE